ncbi:DUF5342 family protein [Alkalicoccus chagannorensis]|uniref:DUF5342 family protein n=1 Tax=Alkalicoccus chagannorensis TaxID=427072 RepID=UPI0004249BCA|nr:DUF5342 family protein [Alkalicoccus chagannorensis]
MIEHFQCRRRPPYGWQFTFYYKQTRHRGIYHQDGRIEWRQPEEPEKESLEHAVHDLMLYHVYEDH